MYSLTPEEIQFHRWNIRYVRYAGNLHRHEDEDDINIFRQSVTLSDCAVGKSAARQYTYHRRDAEHACPTDTVAPAFVQQV